MTSAIFCITLLFGLFGGMVYLSMIEPLEQKKTSVTAGLTPAIAVFAVAALLRIFGAMLYPGHGTDMNCFDAWSIQVFRDGFSAFYTSESFTDYPPGYMYVLYLIGAVRTLFHIDGSGAYLLLKLPAIAADILCGVLIYRLALSRLHKKAALLIGAFFVLNPAVFLDSALWGQVDSVYTLALLILMLLISQGRLIPAYFAFVLAVFIKPQSLIFTPVLLFAFIDQLFLRGFEKKKLFFHLLWILTSTGTFLLFCLPFGIEAVLHQYTDTLSSYPYLTINAFNLWGALNQNWTDLNTFTTLLGFLFLILITAASARIYFASKNPGRAFFTAAFLCLSTFILSTKMHDRYAYPTMIMLLGAYCMQPKRRMMLLYLFTSLMQFFNTAWVLFVYEQDINRYAHSPVIIIGSWINLIIYAYMVYVSQKECEGSAEKSASARMASRPSREKGFVKFQRSASGLFLTKADWILMTSLTLVYGAAALTNLGDTVAPQTLKNLAEQPAVLEFSKPVSLSKMQYYLGPAELNETRTLTISCTDTSGYTAKSEELQEGPVFYWNEAMLNAESVKTVSLNTDADRLYIMELAFYDTNGSRIVPDNANAYPEFFDEQGVIPELSSWRNGTYFDEIYHARTGYEFLHKLPVYEWTHPPLGKLFISAGIRLFGMTPFGWRIAGAVFGIFMVPVLYLTARMITKKTWFAFFAALLFAFDFMHYAQTRISTIDGYGTFFIMLMYLFMYRYYTMSFYDTPLKKTLVPLLLCGIATGLGAASKWTAIYGAAGLALLFALTLVRRTREYLYARRDPEGESNGILHSTVIRSFKPNTIKTVLWCCVFFLVIPAAIYTLSYLPYTHCEGSGGWRILWQNQKDMLTYHAKTVVSATHPYSSRWFSWPVIYRPIFFFNGETAEGLKMGISSFGNPLLWWAGIPAFFYMIIRIIRNRDRTALFLTIGYLAPLIAWIPVDRTTFIYHYFPCVPFVALMVGYSALLLYRGSGKSRTVLWSAVLYSAAAIGLFLLFYPVLTGTPVSADFVTDHLRWFSSWTLVI